MLIRASRATAEPRPVRVGLRDWAVMSLCALLALILAACASPVARREAGPVVGSQGTSWDVVLSAISIEGAGSDSVSLSPERARRDEHLRQAQTAGLPADFWPAPAQPSLRKPQRVTLSRNTDTTVLFVRERRQHGRY